MKPDDEQKHTGQAPLDERQGGTANAPSSPRPGGNPEGRAFVVQVAPDAQLAEGRLRGRVQHLQTIDGGNFESTADLIAIMRRVLERNARSNSEND